MGTIQDKLVYLNKYKKEFIKVLNDKGILLRQDAPLSHVMYSVYFYYKIRVFDEKMKVWKASFFPLDGHDIVSNIDLVKLKEAYKTATGRDLEITPFAEYNKNSSVDDKFTVMKKWKIDMTNQMKTNPLRTSAVNNDASLDNMVKEFMKELDFIIPPITIPTKIKKSDDNQEVTFSDAKPNMVINMEDQDFPYKLNEGIKAIAKPHPPKFQIPVIYKTKYGKIINQGFITVEGSLGWKPEVFLFNKGNIQNTSTSYQDMMNMNGVSFNDNGTQNETKNPFGLLLVLPEDVENKIKINQIYFLLGIFPVEENDQINYSDPILLEYVTAHNYKSDLLTRNGYHLFDTEYNQHLANGYSYIQEGQMFYRNMHSHRFNNLSKGRFMTVKNQPEITEGPTKYLFNGSTNINSLPDSMKLEFMKTVRGTGTKVAVQLFQGRTDFAFKLQYTEIAKTFNTARDAANFRGKQGEERLFDVYDTVRATEPVIVDCEDATINNVPYMDPSFIPILDYIDESGDFVFKMSKPEDDWKLRIFKANITGIGTIYRSNNQVPNTFSETKKNLPYPGAFPIQNFTDQAGFLSVGPDGRPFLRIINTFFTTNNRTTKQDGVARNSSNLLNKFVIHFYFRNHLFRNKTWLNYDKLPFTGDKRIIKQENGQVFKLFTSHTLSPKEYDNKKDLSPPRMGEMSDLDRSLPILKHYYSGGINSEALTSENDEINYLNQPWVHNSGIVTDGSIDIIALEISHMRYMQFFDKLKDVALSPERSKVVSVDKGDLNYPVNLLDQKDISFLDPDSPNYIRSYGIMNAWFWVLDFALKKFDSNNKTFEFYGKYEFQDRLSAYMGRIPEEYGYAIGQAYDGITNFLKQHVTTYPYLNLYYTKNGHPLSRILGSSSMVFSYRKGENKEFDKLTFKHACKVFKKLENNPYSYSSIASDWSNFMNANNEGNKFQSVQGKVFKNLNNSVFSDTGGRSLNISEDVPDNPFMGYSLEANTPNIPDHVHLVYCDVTWRDLDKSTFQQAQESHHAYDIESIERKYPNIRDLQNKGKSVILRIFVDKPSNVPHKDVPDYITTTPYNNKYGQGSNPKYDTDFFNMFSRFLRVFFKFLRQENEHLPNLFSIELLFGHNGSGTYLDNDVEKFIQLPEQIMSIQTLEMWLTENSPKKFFISVHHPFYLFNNDTSRNNEGSMIHSLFIQKAPILGNKKDFDVWANRAYYASNQTLDDNFFPVLSKNANRSYLFQQSPITFPRKYSGDKFTTGTLPDNVNELIKDKDFYSELLCQMKTINPIYVIGYIDKEKHPEKYQQILNEMGYQLAVTNIRYTTNPKNSFDIFIENVGKNPFMSGNSNKNLVPYFTVRKLLDMNSIIKTYSSFSEVEFQQKNKTGANFIMSRHLGNMDTNLTHVFRWSPSDSCMVNTENLNGDNLEIYYHPLFRGQTIEKPPAFFQLRVAKNVSDSNMTNDPFIKFSNRNRTDKISLNDVNLVNFS